MKPSEQESREQAAHGQCDSFIQKFAISLQIRQSVPRGFLMVHDRFQSLYLHFPFCESKCHYCDFYSIGREKTKSGDPDQFKSALKQECSLWEKNLSNSIETIFLGGGTPSMTPPQEMVEALSPLRLQTRLADDYEWTMEVNPSSVSYQNLKGYQELGVNRVSMGVQSLDPVLLPKLGRVHSAAEALRALDAVFTSGFENVSVDLLCGVPGQSLQVLKKSLELLTAFPITHLSCYLLTLTKGHSMFTELPSEEGQLEHLLFIDEWLRARGFEHYEISNFAKPGRKAKHNLNYWTGKSYLGLGPSAHSYSESQNLRWKNISSLHRYADFLSRQERPLDWSEKLTQEQLRIESWMLALRLDTGFPESWLETAAQTAKAEKFESIGLIERHPVKASTLRLTPKGFALSDQIISALA